jgi:hypothetical protein
VDAGGRIARHLASGVLGKNAPWPFKQDSLSQQIEWDGTDDLGNRLSGIRDRSGAADDRSAVAGYRSPFSVRVSLGLKAAYERDIAWSPQAGAYVEKDGKYFRTLWPPPADTPPDALLAAGYKLATTTWGDKIAQVPGMGDWYGPFTSHGNNPARAKLLEALTPLYKDKSPPRNPGEPGECPAGAYDGNPRIAVDPATDELYWLSPGGTPGGRVTRIDGRTGRIDKSWFDGGAPKTCMLNNISEIDVGPDGLIYMLAGPMGYCRFILRMDRSGKPVPFAEKTEEIPTAQYVNDYYQQGAPRLVTDPKHPSYLPAMLATGVSGHSNVHDKGFDVSSGGRMVTIVEGLGKEWAAKHGVVPSGGHFVQVWSLGGRLLSASAVAPAGNLGHGVRMDRDGNLYAVMAGVMPAGQDRLDGISDVKTGYRVFGGHGSLVKFRGLGDKFPLDTGPGAKTGRGEIPGSLWIYGGMSNQMTPDCSCNHGRHDMDGFARSWIPARQLCSLVVLDANGNRVARLGRYGNVDDDGLRFCSPRAVAVSDSAAYVLDHDNRRIVRAALSYAAEGTAALP